MWLVVAGAAAAGCSNTINGAATCPGCGSGVEPSFPTSRPSVTTTTPTPTATVVPSPGGDTLPSSGGYVYIETKSGQTRCQISADSVGCESNFTNSPVVDGQPANGVEVTADGSLRWITGNLGRHPDHHHRLRHLSRGRLDHRGQREAEPGSPTTAPATGCSSAPNRSTSSKLARVDFRVFVEPQQGASYDDQLAVAQAAESLGYSAFFRSDHYVAMSGDGLPGPTDSWVTLAGIARETSSIRLGTLVTSATFRHPGPLAISVAQVDAMSAGRVDFGIGAGWFEAEHLAYAIPFPTLGERFERLGEQLEIMTGLWATPAGETFDYAGTHYTVKDSPALPKPVQRPHPPIIIGGGGAKKHPGTGRAVRRRVQPGLPDAGLRRAAVRPGPRRAGGGRPQPRRHGLLRRVRGVRRDATTPRSGGGRRRSRASPTSCATNTPLVGTPAEIVDRLAPYIEAGVQRVYLQLLDLSDLDHIELFATEVARQLAG